MDRAAVTAVASRSRPLSLARLADGLSQLAVVAALAIASSTLWTSRDGDPALAPFVERLSIIPDVDHPKGRDFLPLRGAYFECAGRTAATCAEIRALAADIEREADLGPWTKCGWWLGC
jgi:hypothetical protein